jgi:hypothetical protein
MGRNVYALSRPRTLGFLAETDGMGWFFPYGSEESLQNKLWEPKVSTANTWLEVGFQDNTWFQRYQRGKSMSFDSWAFSGLDPV